MQERKTMNRMEWGLLVLLSVLWGGAFFCVGIALVELPPLTVVLARVGIAAMFLLVLSWILGHSLPRSVSSWMPFLVMGVLNNVLPFSFLNAGQTMVSVGLASIMNAMTPLFTALVMASFREERLTRNRMVGMLIGVGGVAVIVWPDALSKDARLLGIGLCLSGALSYGFAVLWGRRHLADVAPVKSATCQLVSSTFVISVVVAVVDRPWTLPLPGIGTWLALVALALLGTALAYVVFFEILVRAGGSNAMLVTLLIPVSALLLGNLFLSEPIFMFDIGGAAIIGLGLLFFDGRLPQKTIHLAATLTNFRYRLKRVEGSIQSGLCVRQSGRALPVVLGSFVRGFRSFDVALRSGFDSWHLRGEAVLRTDFTNWLKSRTAFLRRQSAWYRRSLP